MEDMRVKIKLVKTHAGRRMWSIEFPGEYAYLNGMSSSLHYAHAYARFYVNRYVSNNR